MNAARAVGLLAGVAADAMLAGPRRRAGQGPVLPLTRGSRAGLLAGTALVVGVVASRVRRRNPLVQAAGTALATWAALGGASLAADGTAIASALDAGDLDSARERLPNLGHRDPAALDGFGLARAAVESVADSTSSAVVGPLFWGAVAGVPGLLGYRAVRALDAGNGRKANWAASRLDDVTNLVPSRATAALTTVCAPVVGGSAAGAWEVWRRDGSAHQRPNQGQVEAAFAGALEIRLGGRTVYPNGIAERPVLGHGRTPDAGDLTRSVELSRVIGTVAAAGSAVVAAVVGASRHRSRRRDRRHSRVGGT